MVHVLRLIGALTTTVMAANSGCRMSLMNATYCNRAITLSRISQLVILILRQLCDLSDGIG